MGLSGDGASAKLGRSPLRNNGIDISAVAGQAVFSATAEVPAVSDGSACRNHLHQLACDPVQGYFSTQGVDFDVTVFNVAQGHWPVQGFYVYMSVGNVVHINRGRCAFQSYVSVQPLGSQWPSAGMHGDAGVCRHENFIVHAPALPVSARLQARLIIYAVSALAVVHLDLVRMEECTYDDSIVGGWLYRDRSVRVVHRDARLRPHYEVIFLAALGDQRARYHDSNHDKFRGARANHVTPPRLATHASLGPRATSPSLWQRTAHGQFKKHVLLRHSVHQ